MMNSAVNTDITNTAYGQLIALRKAGCDAGGCIEATIDSLMEQFDVSRRQAALVVTQAWTDLEDAGRPAAYVDVSRTTGNMVVINDTRTGCTAIFSVKELLALRESHHNTITRINA